MDLDAHISLLLSSGPSCAAAQRNASSYKTATRAFPRVMPTANQWDYKNIIEKLQVGVGLPGSCPKSCSGRACSREASCPVLHALPRRESPAKGRPWAGHQGPGGPRHLLVGLVRTKGLRTTLSPYSPFLFMQRIIYLHTLLAIPTWWETKAQRG